jgi:endonuclease/exonuclease/phosphatase family metal-dependent hydrolase
MDGTLTIASLNLRFGISPGIEAPYDVTRAIASLDADVIALQEVWRPKHAVAAHEVAAAELGYEVVDLALPRAHNKTSPPPVRDRDGMTGTWWGVAVLARGPLRAEGELVFPSIALDAAERRALVAEITTPWKSTLRVITPHLTYRLWGSSRHLRSLADQTAHAARSESVVLGDFNMWGPVVDRLIPGWQRPVRGRTWPAGRPHSQIDHILVSQALRVVDAVVMPPVGSDHLPVRVTVAPR